MSAITLTNGAASGTLSNVSVVVPASTTAGTYRITVTLGTAEYVYNIIVQ